MTTAEFERKVLQRLRLAAEEGHQALRQKREAEERRSVPHLVSTLGIEAAPDPGPVSGIEMTGMEIHLSSISRLTGRKRSLDRGRHLLLEAARPLGGDAPRANSRQKLD